MKKNEQDILNRISEQIKDIAVPESLSPEKIEEMLQKKELEIKRKKKRRMRYFGGLAAACVVLVAGIFAFQSVPRKNAEKSEDASAEAGKDDTDAVPTADNYDEIYTYIENMYEEMYGNSKRSLFEGFSLGSSGAAEEIAIEESGAADLASSSSKMMNTEAGGDYSTTNVRQDGVDEADSAKTDGRYLYIRKDDDRTISIIDTEEGLKEINTIEVDENSGICEFYMLPEEKQLILIVSRYKETEESSSKTRDVMYLGPEVSETCVVTYDVSDISNPKEEGFVSQSGSYTSSRLSGNYIYLFSNYNTGNNFAKEEPATYVPLVNEKLLEAGDIYLPSLDQGCMYEIITSVDIRKPDEVIDSKAFFTEGGQLYVSGQNIYYYETEWAQDTDKTHIRKISYKDGELGATAQCKFNGYINDSFSIDEYDGYLRIVTTVGDTNSVLVMDEQLKTTGKIEGLAEDERIYSARFMGETGYFVTFRETDPLFTVDLSNPKDPQIIGKLKIPGFSEYLQFYGEDKLLGIGMNVDEGTGMTDGVKLSMFDIRDKTDVKEADTYVLENVYSADVFYDYKAVLINAEKNIIGFAAYPEGSQKYYLFSYDDENGFQCNLQEELNGNASRTARGLYIKDILYVVQGNVIEAYNLIEFKKVDDIIV